MKSGYHRIIHITGSLQGLAVGNEVTERRHRSISRFEPGNQACGSNLWIYCVRATCAAPPRPTRVETCDPSLASTLISRPWCSDARRGRQPSHWPTHTSFSLRIGRRHHSANATRRRWGSVEYTTCGAPPWCPTAAGSNSRLSENDADPRCSAAGCVLERRTLKPGFFT
jgi:hypothetical protein